MYVCIYVKICKSTCMYIWNIYAKKAHPCAIKYCLKEHPWSCHTFRNAA